MRRIGLFVFAALLAARAASADGPTARPPRPPEAPDVAYPHDGVATATFHNPVSPTSSVYVFTPTGGAPPPKDGWPILVFLHGFGAVRPEAYGEWTHHLARRGAAVVYPTYPALDAPGAATRYDVVLAGLLEAVARLDGTRLPKGDRSRLGVVGHSFGGGAAPAIATRAAARGLGARALCVAAYAPWFDLDEDAGAALPARAMLLAVAFADDDVCDPEIATGLLVRAARVPEDRKARFTFLTDDRGLPALIADHRTPATFLRLDALDTRGCWPLLDALTDAAWLDAKDARARLFGPERKGVDLGAWSDGVSVKGPVVGSAPPDAAHPRRITWRAGGASEQVARRLGEREAWSSLPLPDPALAPTVGLPAADRFLARPPSPPWPAEVAEALGEGPVLVVREPGPAAASWLDGDGVRAALAKAGVRTVATRLAETPSRGPDGAATALLLARDGTPRLWRRTDDPRLLAAVVALAKEDAPPAPATVSPSNPR